MRARELCVLWTACLMLSVASAGCGRAEAETSSADGDVEHLRQKVAELRQALAAVEIPETPNQRLCSLEYQVRHLTIGQRANAKAVRKFADHVTNLQYPIDMAEPPWWRPVRAIDHIVGRWELSDRQTHGRRGVVRLLADGQGAIESGDFEGDFGWEWSADGLCFTGTMGFWIFNVISDRTCLYMGDPDRPEASWALRRLDAR